MKFFSAAFGTALLSALALAKTGPKTIAYVEVNNNPLANVARYTLDDGSPVFDIGIIFAANINTGSNGQAVLYNNAQVTSTLQNAATQIRPLQNKGIKVLLSILGNHQCSGIANFQSLAAAQNFASQVASVVNQYGLDGVDLDDEYANYGGSCPATNNQSIGWLIQALRSALGSNKLITFYAIGPAYQELQSTSSSIASTLDAAWNPYYGSYSAPTIPGLGKSKLSAAAIDYGSTSQSTAVSFAQRTISDGYGIYLTYSLPNSDVSSYISAYTNVLYGQNAHFQ